MRKSKEPSAALSRSGPPAFPGPGSGFDDASVVVGRSLRSSTRLPGPVVYQDRAVAIGTGWLAFRAGVAEEWWVVRDTDIEIIAVVVPPVPPKRRRRKARAISAQLIVRDVYGRVMALSVDRLCLAAAERITALVPRTAVVTPAARRILSRATPAAPSSGSLLYDLLAGVALFFGSVSVGEMLAFMDRTANLSSNAPAWQPYFLPYFLVIGVATVASLALAVAAKRVARRRGQKRTRLATAAQVMSWIVVLFALIWFGGSGDGGGGG